ncbi:unnamed protein product [Diamesa tonsa]
MVLRFVFVLLISSVLIACGHSCDNVALGTARRPEYVNFNGGFFFVHGLTNGESVVMYKIPDEKKINVQYTFINDDCFFETRSYNIMEDGQFVDHLVIVKKKKKDFSISKKLSFKVDGKSVEIAFLINDVGLVRDINILNLEPFVSLKSNDPLRSCSTGEQINDVSNIEFSNKNMIELKYLKNGRFFYQEYKESIEGKYAFKTTRGHYYTLHYTIDNPFKNYSTITEKSFTHKDDDKFSENVRIDVKNQESIKQIRFCFQSTGVQVIKNDNSVSGLSNGGIAPKDEVPHAM